MQFDGIDSLEQELGRPWPETVSTLSRLEGDVLVLGAGGKMGPTLCRLLKTATQRRVLAVSRFSDVAARQSLEAVGVETVAADLLAGDRYGDLPDAENVFFLAGMKFGASSDQALTWAMNTHVPALVAERYRDSRIVVFSTGNVYPFVGTDGAGADEDTPVDPVGEYAQSCLGRERIFQYFSGRNETPVTIVRLNYANEPRYGIIVDIAQKVLEGPPVDLSMGHANLIWQGDANNYIASAISLAASPARTINVAGDGVVSIRGLAATIGRIVGRRPELVGEEAPTALLSDARACFEQFGPPRVGVDTMVEAVVDWLEAGQPTLGKPTKYQIRDGTF